MNILRFIDRDPRGAKTRGQRQSAAPAVPTLRESQDVDDRSYLGAAPLKHVAVSNPRPRSPCGSRAQALDSVGGGVGRGGEERRERGSARESQLIGVGGSVRGLK
jgi:hypothetical protein